MNLAVIGEHRDFFRQHRWLECDSLLSKNQLITIESEINGVLKKKIPSAQIGEFGISTEQMFAAGRDLWRESVPLKKIVLSKNLAEVASELIEQKPLRFGYEVLFPSIEKALDRKSVYADLLNKTLTINEISSLQGVLCGLMLCLKAPGSSEEIAGLPSTIFSTKPGNGVYFAPDFPMPFDELLHRRGFSYLMLVYTQSKAVYRLEVNDPHAYEFKQLGYNFGDRMSDKLNPLVYV